MSDATLSGWHFYLFFLCKLNSVISTIFLCSLRIFLNIYWGMCPSWQSYSMSLSAAKISAGVASFIFLTSLFENDIVTDDFSCFSFNAVYSSYPFELVLGFEIFGDVFGFHHLFDEGVEHLLCLSVDLGAVLIQFALGEESCEKDGVMFF